MWRVVLKREEGAWRFGFEMREGLDGVGSRGLGGADLGPSREGRKKGAFSGALGGSLGLLRWRMVSRWRRVCQRLLGTRLSVIMSSLSWSPDGTMISGSESTGSSSSNAASMMPWLLSPDVVGAAT